LRDFTGIAALIDGAIAANETAAEPASKLRPLIAIANLRSSKPCSRSPR
jgi:hypothetical protein